MGRVVKGVRLREERYTLPAPEIAPPQDPQAHADVAADLASYDDYGFAAAAEESPFGDAPLGDFPLDLGPIQSQAQALIDDAKQEADRLLAEADARAQALVEEAGARAEQIEAEARRAGHDAGFEEGRASADAEMNEMLATMRELLEMARVERHKLIESAEPELVRLALGIAERVLHQQVALDRGVVVEMAKNAIARLFERDTVTVRVNPADLERMREHREELVAIGDIRNLRVVEDQRVDRGGVVVETEAGTIDARITTQLDEARKILHIEDDIVIEPAPSALRQAHDEAYREPLAS
jgi:flagellar assembly protein FliH